jgi:hypothetical protein
MTWSEAWDVESGEQFNLLKEDVVAGLMLRVRRREFWFVHMGPPCATFSLARWPRLRSAAHMWGLPSLKPHVVKLARDGSLLCCVAVEVARLCHSLDIGFVIENPMSSMMWNFPPMVDLLGREGVVSIILDYCQYGERWRKSTRLVSNREELLALSRRCSGSFRRCSSTGHEHQVLRGASPSGELWTKVACPYPRALCEAYARAISSLAPAVTGAPVKPTFRRPPSEPVVELGPEWRDSSRWKMLFRGDWRQVEHNNILEARGVVAVLRHLSRTSRAWKHRVLIFTDSMVSLGSLAKGRSSARGLLRVCRLSAAVQLTCGIRLYLRWVPSELNYADGPSRRERLGVARGTKEAHKLRGLSRRMSRYFRALKVKGGRSRHW